MRLLPHCLKITLPVLFGFIPMGIAWGVLFNQLGYPWFFSPLMSALVFAGSVQFVSIGMLAMHASIPEILLMSLVVNSRQAFFGMSMLHKYQVKGWRKVYLMWMLTDEVYSLLTSKPAPPGSKTTSYYLLVSFLVHSYWVIGSAIGTLLSQSISFDSNGMEFTLTSLFIILCIDQYRKVKANFPFAFAIFAAIVGIVIFGKQYMLLSSISLTILALIIKGRAVQWNQSSI